ncbi:hypothetical protein BGZ83_010307 [Gryganskiella cystojenkinii]|nr:hypothetical protein BGZ83_010307 [Gryganskiella cystojenkinii]
MPEPITIFEIPLLVKIIAHALDSDSIISCRKVCKAWHESFTPYEWHSVKIVTATPAWCEVPDDEDFIPLHKNARLVRILDLDNSRLLEPLLNPSIPDLDGYDSDDYYAYDDHYDHGVDYNHDAKHDFTRLIVLSSDMIHRSNGDQDWAFRSHPELMPKLIKQNTGLQALHLRDLDLSKSKYNLSLFRAIGQLCSLKHLEYGIYDTLPTVKSTVLQQILQGFPVESLKSLRVGPATTKVPRPFVMPTKINKDGKGQQNMIWRPTKLERLELRLDLRGTEELTLFPFLFNCPELMALSIGDIDASTVATLAKILQEQCPKLIELDLCGELMNVGTVSLLLKRGFARNQLRSLSLGGWSSMVQDLSTVQDPSTVDWFDIWPTLLKSFGLVLQKLCLREGLGILFEDFAEIFMKCPELRELSLEIPFYPGTYYQYKTCTHLFTVREPWVCTHLEVLQFTIKDQNISLHPEAAKALSRQEKESLRKAMREDLKALLVQLGRLTSLREIHLEWYPGVFMEPEWGSFSEAFEPNWHHLERLSRLERFMVRTHGLEPPRKHNDDLHPFKKPHRVEWFKKYWPRLQVIQELFVKR